MRSNESIGEDADLEQRNSSEDVALLGRLQEAIGMRKSH